MSVSPSIWKCGFIKWGVNPTAYIAKAYIKVHCDSTLMAGSNSTILARQNAGQPMRFVLQWFNLFFIILSSEFQTEIGFGRTNPYHTGSEMPPYLSSSKKMDDYHECTVSLQLQTPSETLLRVGFGGSMYPISLFLSFAFFFSLSLSIYII